MKTTLRRCPFCGSHPEVHREGTRGYSCVIGCANCGCKLESNEIGYGDEWNRRFEDTPIAAQVIHEIVPSIAEEVETCCPRCAGSGDEIEISAIKLVRKGDHAVVEIETETGWTEVISEFVDAPFSHIVEEAGMQRCLMQSDRAKTNQGGETGLWQGCQHNAKVSRATLEKTL
jgi:transcription initiation factor TFIIIB Brf1 subunit/transcription initiation factor TFIIB